MNAMSNDLAAPAQTDHCRGLPLGYLNQLEQRLAETESALYGALVTLRSMRPTTVVQASTKPDSGQKQKAARMDEWSQLPLRGWADMERWLAAMSEQFTIEQSQSLPFTDTSSGYRNSPRAEVEAQGPSAIYTWQPREEIHMGRPYEAHLRLQVIGSSPVYSRGPRNAGPDSVASPAVGLPEDTNVAVAGESGHTNVSEGGESAQAEELSKSKPGIYF